MNGFLYKPEDKYTKFITKVKVIYSLLKDMKLL